MKKNRYFWSRLTHRKKVAVYLPLIALLIYLLYFFAGCPPFSPAHRYYRAARDHLVGPGKILAHLELEKMDYTDLILAEDEENIILYITHEHDFEPAELACREKTGDLTVLAAPCYRGGSWSTALEQHLPVFLFDEYPEAARAEMELTLSTHSNGEDFSKTYKLESHREYDGFFQFDIFAHNAQGLKAEGYALHAFSNLSANALNPHIGIAVPVTVRLYGSDNCLILERHLEVRSTAGQAHIQ